MRANSLRLRDIGHCGTHDFHSSVCGFRLGYMFFANMQIGSNLPLFIPGYARVILVGFMLKFEDCSGRLECFVCLEDSWSKGEKTLVHNACGVIVEHLVHS